MTGTFAHIRRLARHPSGLFGLLLLAAIILMSVSAGWIFPEGPWAMVGPTRLHPGVDPRFPLGTDTYGRDIVSAIFYGARVSLFVGIASAAIALIVGIVVGAIAGYFGGKVDDALMRLTDAFQTIPNFLLSIAIVGIIGASLPTITFAISIVAWPIIARLVRADVLRLRTYDFVQSCKIIGMSDMRIVFQQILPNCMAPIIVTTSVLVANAIIVEASLAFLGLGDPNVMSWGTLLNVGRQQLRTEAYITIVPAVALVLTVLALNLIGDALNDVLNPRLKERT
ncbi:ABC transporter permease [Pseudoroseicyclus tamaricis]|uniref:ABC transporter permease n=1 Tax=Pseudoroseicyclus tamaricis TaxID=2705421 RepID=A0A6B2K3R7_9RHOB|nr:ABC transporter permease [Pseudoroseicyclus tamaricis]NDV01256.1 ABC transporter permease [Pseudoroseicyclus tamaricis]